MHPRQRQAEGRETKKQSDGALRSPLAKAISCKLYDVIERDFTNTLTSIQLRHIDILRNVAQDRLVGR
jgi:hypothetical protein